MLERDKKLFTKELGCIDSLIEDAARNINELVRLNPGSKRLVIAISKKGPHLMSGLRNYLDDNQTDYISELALPFVNTKEYDSFVIVDDAVYHGFTFEHITRLLISTIEIKEGNFDREISILSIPLVVANSSKVISPKSLINGIVIDSKEYTTLIDYEDEAFYTNTMIDYIYSRNVPHDIEVPILRLEYDCSPESIINELAYSIKYITNREIKSYKVERYNRTDGKLYKSYSLVLDPLYEGTNKFSPDFAKLRLLFNEEKNELIISSYCISAINDDDILKGSFFSSAFQKEIWQPLINELGKYSSRRTLNTVNHSLYGDFIISHDADRFQATWNYHYQTRQTLAILANWLISFLQLYQLRTSLYLTIGIAIPDYHLNIQDLAFIIGKESAFDVISSLNNWIKQQSGGFYNPEIMPHRSLSAHKSRFMPAPSIYAVGFETSLYDAIEKRKNRNNRIEDAISFEFSLMHDNIYNPSRNRKSNPQYRLQYGETYPSLCDRLLKFGIGQNDEDRKIGIHKALDLRIDSGSVVAQYHLQKVEEEYFHWVRSFRNGENEDYRYTQLNRCLIFLLLGSFNKDGIERTLFTSDSFYALIAMASERIEAESLASNGLYHLLGFPARWDSDGNIPYISVKVDEDSDYVSLIQLMLDNNLIQESNVSRLYKFELNRYTVSLLNYSVYTEEIDQIIIDASHSLKKYALSPGDNIDITAWLLADNHRMCQDLKEIHSILVYSLDSILNEKEESPIFADYSIQRTKLIIDCKNLLYQIYWILPTPFDDSKYNESKYPEIVIDKIESRKEEWCIYQIKCLIYLALYSVISLRFNLEDTADSLFKTVKLIVSQLFPRLSQSSLIQNDKTITTFINLFIKLDESNIEMISVTYLRGIADIIP